MVGNSTQGFDFVLDFTLEYFKPSNQFLTERFSQK